MGNFICMAAASMLSLVHLTQPPRIPSLGPPPLLLLLHGVGSNESDLIGLAPSLDGRFFIVSARAPIALGPEMYGWFHVMLDPVTPMINPDEAERSRLILLQFIHEATQAYGTDPHRVYLLGFSQGAIMSLSLALTRPDTLAGVVAMSGRILPEVLPHAAPPQAMRGLPVLIVHGTEDPVLPIHHGRAARDLLSALPVSLTYRENPIGHYVSEESLAEVAAWLWDRLEERPWTERLGRATPGTT